MLGNVFKAYDIRGVYPDALTDNMAWQIGYGSSAYLISDAAASGKRDPMMTYIVVGRDMRKSSPKLSELLADGITQQGGNVIDVGMVDTPFVYFAINRLDCAGGIAVTASHNPPQYNGFKVSKRRAKPVGEGFGLEEIRKQAAMADRTKIKALRKDPSKQREPLNPPGRVETRDLWDAYREHVLQFVDRDAIAKRGLRVVVDASNAMAGTMTPKVFGEAKIEGLEIIPLHFDNTKGEFAHEPNPLVAANLADVQAKVKEEKADLGLCFDGDADRCMLIDEQGEIVGCDLLTAWLAGDALKRNPGAAVVYDLRSSKAVEEEVEKAGGEAVRSRVGHVFMKEKMAAKDAVFGGELSGHFYFRENFYADSGAIAMATALSALARDRKPLSRIIKPLARYAQSGEVNFEVEDKDEALAALEEKFAIRGEIDTLDGVTIDCWDPDGWWFNVRKSNTEPLLRLNLEARNKTTLAKMMEEVSPILGTPVHH